MIIHRPAHERGKMNYGWLDTHYSFSFAEYFDSNHMGFRKLRVINQDIIQPRMGFATHPHRNMEILSYILRGELKHEDSLGNSSILKAGDVQRMSAGRGVRHSEYNASSTDELELLQIWIEPATMGLDPSYEEIPKQDISDLAPLTPIATPTQYKKKDQQNGDKETLTLHQDVTVFRGKIHKSEELTYPLDKNRYVWLQMIEGEIRVNDHLIGPGDGLAVSQQNLELHCKTNCHFLLFDLC